jgi:cell wall-associated NlpC family hydrolase
MKRLIITAIAMSLLFTACSSTSLSIVKPEVTYAVEPTTMLDQQEADFFDIPTPAEYKVIQEARAAEKAKALRELETRRAAIENTTKMAEVIKKLKRTAGATPYVFSGSSPSGWDCSGLVLWTYRQMGVELYHGATMQYRSGTIVNDPLPGDLVAYVYGKSTSTGHVGIYIGDGKAIHSLKPGTRTRIESSEQGVMNHGGMRTVYIRIIPLIPQSEMPKNRLDEIGLIGAD